MMAESQFHQILQMGQHIFLGMFVHQLLCRQLVTAKLYELWWTFAGKPIRYGIGEFVLVIEFSCGKARTTSLGTLLDGHPKKKGKSKGKVVVGSGAVWKELFGTEDKTGFSHVWHLVSNTKTHTLVSSLRCCCSSKGFYAPPVGQCPLELRLWCW
ncbi:hypothetical protein N665_1205s0002 [Sinapis alba]|nr:hypothetical protein N665_1205s0002 [Sinapis alba]